jgi:hypothetical protein
MVGGVRAPGRKSLQPSVRFRRKTRHLREDSVPAHEYPSAVSHGRCDQQVLACYGGATPKRLRTDPTGLGRFGEVERKDLQAVEEFQSPRELSSPAEVSSDKDFGRSPGWGRETLARLHEVPHFPDRIRVALEVIDQEG